MWDYGRLQQELRSYTKSSSANGTPSVLPPTLRHFVVYLRIDRVVCYQRNLLTGLFKLRVSICSPTASRPPAVFESRQPVPAGSVLRQEGFFRMPIPVNVAANYDQLCDWRVEFEVLHKYPAAPVYSVAARAWISLDLLTRASAIDLFSPDAVGASEPLPAVRLQFGSVATSGLAVNFFRSVAKAVLFATKLALGVARSKASEVERLESQIRFINTRNAHERQALQMDLMMQTVQTMNKYMESGSKPNQWLEAMREQGLLGAGDGGSTRALELKFSDLGRQVDGLRNDVIKGLLEQRQTNVQPPQIIQYVQNVPPVSPPREGEMVENIAPPPRVRTPVLAVIPTPPVTIDSVDVPVKPVASESTHGPISVAPVVPVSVSDTMTSLWGAVQAAVGPSAAPSEIPRKKSSLSTTPLVEAIRGTTPKAEREPTPARTPPASGAPIPPAGPTSATPSGAAAPKALQPVVADAIPESVKKPASTKKAVAVSTVKSPPKKAASVAPKAKPAGTANPAPVQPADPKAKLIAALQAKQQAAKAKMALMLKLQEMEAKRKAEMQKVETEIVTLAKKLPPVDRFKFIGLPGPPPFAPKAKAKAAGAADGIPSALAPPPVHDSEGGEQVVEEGGEVDEAGAEEEAPDEET